MLKLSSEPVTGRRSNGRVAKGNSPLHDKQSERELAGERHGSESASSRQTLSPSQQVALEELADRVNAARSVV